MHAFSIVYRMAADEWIEMHICLHMYCFLIGGVTKVEASESEYDYISRLNYGVWFTPVRTVTMVTDIWMQVFDVPLPDVPVMHDDILCERLEESISRFTSF